MRITVLLNMILTPMAAEKRGSKDFITETKLTDPILMCVRLRESEGERESERVCV